MKTKKAVVITMLQYLIPVQLVRLLMITILKKPGLVAIHSVVLLPADLFQKNPDQVYGLFLESSYFFYSKRV